MGSLVCILVRGIDRELWSETKSTTLLWFPIQNSHYSLNIVWHIKQAGLRYLVWFFADFRPGFRYFPWSIPLILVLKYVNLPIFNSFQQPFHCEIEHKLGMTCLTTGPVTCRVRLDRGGYVPGEAINIWATIDNQSKVTIKGTRSCLTEVSWVRN